MKIKYKLMFKKVIRGILKIPLTPVVLFWNGGMIVLSYAVQVFEWLYNSSDFDKRITKEVQDDYIDNIKKWFTTI